MSLGVAILVYLVGICMLIIEVFTPGMFVGVLGTVALIAGVYGGFTNGALYGVAMIVAAVAVVPAAFIFGLKRLALKKAQNDADGYTSGPAGLETLISREGTALTPLRPSGTAVIDGKRVDVVTEGEMIDKDKPVRVIKVEGGRVVVRMV